MTSAWARLGVAMATALVFGLTGVAWAADCGDTSGPGATRIPCSCGDTVTTDTKLLPTDPVVSTEPADVCLGDGLSLSTSGVTLDCSGLTIRGDDTDTTDVGLRILDGVNDLVIKRCVVSRFGTGIGTDGTTDGSLIRNNEIKRSKDDGVTIAGDGNRLVANRVTEIADACLRSHGSGNTIEKNVAKDCGGDGICVTNPGGAANVDHGGNIAKRATPADCAVACEIDGTPCKGS